MGPRSGACDTAFAMGSMTAIAVRLGFDHAHLLALHCIPCRSCTCVVACRSGRNTVPVDQSRTWWARVKELPWSRLVNFARQLRYVSGELAVR